MTGNFVKIISYGLIGESEDGSNYRHVIFEDLSNERKTEYIVNKKQRPSLWNDIEQMEKGKTLPPYKGYITSFNGVDIVVLGDETLENAFTKQKWKLEKQKNLSRKEANRVRKVSKGFSTNLTYKNALEYPWNNIEKGAKTIRFRYYTGKGSFSWSTWYEIED